MNARFIGGPWDGRTEVLPDHLARTLPAAFALVSPARELYDGMPMTKLPDGRFAPTEGLTEYRFTRMESDDLAIFEPTP